MDGTTLCPHCNTRFKIEKTQMSAHHGKVRCGHCLQTFDARPSFIPDHPDPQLKLPMDDHSTHGQHPHVPLASPFKPDNAGAVERIHPETISPDPALTDSIDTDYDSYPAATPRGRSWLWGLAVVLAALVFSLQAIYVFRTDISVRIPAMKPLLQHACRILKCSVPLPQETELMSIESSNLEVEDATQSHRITLNALLRNRAPYAQAFPDLELTLNDSMDKPLARRIFHPVDYLPNTESVQLGIRANHELSLKLHLDTPDLDPIGYRLVLLYSSN